MNSMSKYKVRFLSDIPEPLDELGIHEKIAEVIRGIINNEGLKNSEKKVIGLFGSWGSGKSTVIEVLKKNLGNNVFIFDSWSHKGDFLKRAFLIELARHLNVLDEKFEEMQDERKELKVSDILTRKIVTRDIYTNVETNKWIIFFTSFILLSIVLKTMDISIYDNLLKPVLSIFFHYTPSVVQPLINWSWIILIIIFMSPVLLRDKFKKFIEYYVLKKYNLTETHATREDLEFTNYDYEIYFERIFQVAKNKRGNGKSVDVSQPFIIVFDNLDRVDDETILNTLSLIQLNTEIVKRNPELNRNLYFVVPIDKERLLKTIENGVFKENADNIFAEEFLKKIFPYEVNIPEIKHSDWRAFFDKMFKEAFEPSDKDNNELGEKLLFIRRIFEESIRSSKKNLTPREIKNFINSLGSNYLFWKDRIDIRLQALYVASKNYLFEGLRTYILTELEKEEDKSNEDEKEGLKQLIEIAKKEFSEDQVKEAMLKQYYGVEEIHTLFVDRIIVAVRKNDINEINQIFSIFEDRNKVERLLRCVWDRANEYRDSINSLLSLSYCLRQSDLSEDFIFNDFYEKEIIPTLREQINNLEKLVDLESTMLEELIRIIQEDNNLKKLLIENSAKIIISYGSENEEG